MFASHINWNWNLYVSRNYVGRYHKKSEVFIILRNQNTNGLDKKKFHLANLGYMVIYNMHHMQLMGKSG